MTIEFAGAALPATPAGIDGIAFTLEVEPAVFRAVIAVEAAGSGFDAKRRPKALFERHHLHRHLRADPAKLERAVAEGLAYPKWGEKPYPKGSDAVYDEIARAAAIDFRAALLSTSWGLGQVMGSNFQMAGCRSVEEMWEQAKESETHQLRHMAGFIRSARLVPALQAKDWVAFARGYNGPGFAQNKYDEKLAQAYGRFTRQAAIA